jgi:hypothetical protein
VTPSAVARGERVSASCANGESIALRHGQRELRRQNTEEATHAKPGV